MRVCVFDKTLPDARASPFEARTPHAMMRTLQFGDDDANVSLSPLFAPTPARAAAANAVDAATARWQRSARRNTGLWPPSAAAIRRLKRLHGIDVLEPRVDVPRAPVDALPVAPVLHPVPRFRGRQRSRAGPLGLAHDVAPS